MTNPSCPSTFIGVRCDLPQGHAGAHTNSHSSGHITAWDTTAADWRAAR
jgi:hypothetical protein